MPGRDLNKARSARRRVLGIPNEPPRRSRERDPPRPSPGKNPPSQTLPAKPSAAEAQIRVSSTTVASSKRRGDVVRFDQLDALDRGHPDHGQAGGAGGGDAGRGVLQGDHARPRLDPEATAGLQVGVGRRLRLRHFVAADDGVEDRFEADDLQRAQDEGERRVGDQADRRPLGLQPFEQVAGADHRLHPVLELGDDQLVRAPPSARPAALLARATLPAVRGDRGRFADQFALVVGGELEAVGSNMSCSARVQTDSVSSSRPSLSKRTASGRRGGMAAHHVNPARPTRTAPKPGSVAPTMPFHIEVATGRRHARSFNLTEEELGRTVLDPWLSGRADPARRPQMEARRRDSRLKILEGPELSIQDLAFSQGWANAERSAADVTATVLGRPPRAGGRSAGRRRWSSTPTRRCRRWPRSSPVTTPKRVSPEQVRERIDGRDPAVAAVILVVQRD